MQRKKMAEHWKPIIKVGKDIPILEFLRSRLVTPKEFIAALKDIDCTYHSKSISSILFHARYKAGKAIKGYDFFDIDPVDYSDDIV